MKLNDQVILNLRLEAVRLANGDLPAAAEIVKFLTAETPAEAAEREATVAYALSKGVIIE
jgi:hypothetical protein